METTKFELKDNLKVSHRRENGFSKSYQLIAFTGDKFIVAVDLRLYNSASRVYACVWIDDHVNKLYGSGSDYAGGYGYHKASAAASGAFNSAGIDFNESIDGRGDSAIESALHAIAKSVGYANYFVNEAHP